MTAEPKQESQPPEEVQKELEQGIVELERHSFADTAGTRTDLRRLWRWAVFGIGLFLSIFHLYTGIFGTLPSLQQRSLHLALGLGLVFLLYPTKPRRAARERTVGWVLTGLGVVVLVYLAVMQYAGLNVVLPAFGVLVLVQAARYLPWTLFGLPAADVALSILAFAAGLFPFFQYEEISRSIGAIDPVYSAVGTVGVMIVLVAAQRVLGNALVLIAGAMLAYAFLGQLLPGFLQHRGFTIDRIISTSFLTTEGVFGTPIAISATFIFLFMIFAAMLQRSGMERFFTELAFGATGWMTGGTAKVGVVTSAFSGTITGSSIANTVSNGAFTIPMMKKSGYKPEVAGAVEAASSTGGQLAPPIMGAAAFIMIEFTGLPYIEIIKAAIVPAILFFVGQFVVIHYYSKRAGITGLPRSALPNVRSLMLRKGYLLLPVIIIFIFLSLGYSPMFSAVAAIGATVGVNILAQLVALLIGRWQGLEDRLTPRNLLDGLVDATRIAIPIIVACAAAGMIAGIITLTGLGLKLSDGLLDLAQGQLLLTLLFAMIACLILGIGLPTTANYVITATLAAPAIIQLPEVAIPVIAAHMFVYYFGVMADITPPVCLAAYAASGIAQSNPIRTGVESVRIAVSGFVVPFMFVLSPELLLQEVNWFTGTWAAVTGVLGASAVAVGVVGYFNRSLNPVLRLVAAVGGISLLHFGATTDLIGVALLAAIVGQQWWTTRPAKTAAAATA